MRLVIYSNRRALVICCVLLHALRVAQRPFRWKWPALTCNVKKQDSMFHFSLGGCSMSWLFDKRHSLVAFQTDPNHASDDCHRRSTTWLKSLWNDMSTCHSLIQASKTYACFYRILCPIFWYRVNTVQTKLRKEGECAVRSSRRRFTCVPLRQRRSTGWQRGKAAVRGLKRKNTTR